MRKIFSLLLFISYGLNAQITVTVDKDWKAQSAFIKNSLEADYIIRLGDVDNLGFGWPVNFDPFCGKMTEAHPFPWKPSTTDLPGFDRILLSGKYKPAGTHSCLGDGYSESYNPASSKPVKWELPVADLNGVVISNAFLQLFIDDFQAPSMCSKFTILINGAHFVEGERFLNAIDQTGPVGKLITIPLPEEFYQDFATKTLTVAIDEATGAPDGFAVDFIRLLINRKRDNSCIGNVSGTVLIKDTDIPVAGANVATAGKQSVKTDASGAFGFKNIPAGFEVLVASAPGYADGSAAADIGPGDENAPVTIFLEKGKSQVSFGGSAIKVGESIRMNNILFDQGKDILKPESKPELDKIVNFLKQNPGAEIELSGHTSSEGDVAANRSLSYRRVKACKDYIVLQDVETSRIISVGFGSDKPVAPNDTEVNRAKNRRVELRLLKL